MALKKGDFITINYTGKLADGTIFDTTLPTVAKEHGIQTQKALKPVTICIGQHHVVPGLDAQLEGKELGKHTCAIPAEGAFGKKSAKLLRLIPQAQFKKQGINPQPGMELNIDNQFGIVRSASGGRIIVDFNHPLAGQDVVYDIDIIKQVTDLTVQTKALLDIVGIPYKDVSAEGTHITVHVTSVLPPQITDVLHQQITTLTKAEKLSFETQKEQQQPAPDKKQEQKE